MEASTSTPKKQLRPKWLPNRVAAQPGEGIQMTVTKSCSIRELKGVTFLTSSERAPDRHIRPWFRALSPWLFSMVDPGHDGTLQTQAMWEGQRRYQPFVLFSDRHYSMDIVPQGGSLLAKLIKDEKLGVLHETNPKVNWTAQTVKAWLWEVDYEATAALLDRWNEEDGLPKTEAPAASVGDAKPAEAPASCDQQSPVSSVVDNRVTNAPIIITLGGVQAQFNEQCSPERGR